MSSREGDRITQAKVKAGHYCARGERSPKQVVEKLMSYGLDHDEAQFVLNQLREDKYVDETRFASAFANDKFRFNKWGRIKIRLELIHHKIPSRIIETGLSVINFDDYHEMVDNLIEGKWNKLNTDENYLSRKKKTLAYLAQKGFESEIVMRRLDQFCRNIGI